MTEAELNLVGQAARFLGVPTAELLDVLEGTTEDRPLLQRYRNMAHFMACQRQLLQLISPAARGRRKRTKTTIKNEQNHHDKKGAHDGT